MSPERPTPVPEGVIEELMDRPEITALFKPTSLRGKKLRVESGPWNMFEGVCEWSTEKRVGVLLSVFGRPATVIDMDRKNVRVV
jgi:transcription antitermination factor NusG